MWSTFLRKRYTFPYQLHKRNVHCKKYQTTFGHRVFLIWHSIVYRKDRPANLHNAEAITTLPNMPNWAIMILDRDCGDACVLKSKLITNCQQKHTQKSVSSFRNISQHVIINHVSLTQKSPFIFSQASHLGLPRMLFRRQPSITFNWLK